MKKAFNAVRKVTDWIVIVLFAVLVALVLFQVITRFLHISQTWVDEISKFVFVWLTYIGGAVTVSRGMNITFDLILEGVKGKTYKILFTFVNIMCLLFMIAMFIVGVKQSWDNRVQVSTMTQMNMGIMNSAIPVGFLLMIGSQIEFYFRRLKEKEAEEAKAAEAKEVAQS